MHGYSSRSSEFAYLRQLSYHNNILRLFARTEGPNGENGFVTEYCERGDLNAILRAVKPGDKSDVKTLEVKKSSRPIADQIDDLKKELEKVQTDRLFFGDSPGPSAVRGRATFRRLCHHSRSHQAAPAGGSRVGFALCTNLPFHTAARFGAHAGTQVVSSHRRGTRPGVPSQPDTARRSSRREERKRACYQELAGEAGRFRSCSVAEAHCWSSSCCVGLFE